MKFFTTAAILGVASARFSKGACPKVEYMDKIEKSKYTGKWYETYRDNWNIFTIGAECVTKEYALDENEDIDLYFRGNYLVAGYQGVDGKLSGCGDHGKSTCYATMHNHHWGKWKELIPFNVLDTDYENYEVYYDCHNILFGLFKWTDFAVYSRS